MRTRLTRTNKKGLMFSATAATSKASQSALDAINNTLDIIAEESASLVPTDTGALKGSLYVEYATPSNPRGAVGYGGPNDVQNPISGKMTSEYAWDVHEDLDVYHETGQAKFLEVPVRRHREELKSTIKSIVAETFQKEIGR